MACVHVLFNGMLIVFFFTCSTRVRPGGFEVFNDYNLWGFCDI